VTRRLPGLGDDEPVLAVAPASFRGACAASARGMFAVGSARIRLRAYDAWEQAANAAGFPAAGPDMVLAATDARLVVWRTTFVLGRPHEVAGSVPFERVAQVAAVRHGLVTGLALVLTGGVVVEVEAMRGRRLRALARVVDDALARRGRRA
jgi:hypothetical protein